MDMTHKSWQEIRGINLTTPKQNIRIMFCLCARGKMDGFMRPAQKDFFNFYRRIHYEKQKRLYPC